jgi:hypothetical protein
VFGSTEHAITRACASEPQAAPAQPKGLDLEAELNITKGLIDDTKAALAKVNAFDFTHADVFTFRAMVEKLELRQDDKYSACYFQNFEVGHEAGATDGMLVMSDLCSLKSSLEGAITLVYAVFDDDLDLSCWSVIDCILPTLVDLGITVSTLKCHRVRFELWLTKLYDAGSFDEILDSVTNDEPLPSYTIAKIDEACHPSFQRKWIGKVFTSLLISSGNHSRVAGFWNFLQKPCVQIKDIWLIDSFAHFNNVLRPMDVVCCNELKASLTYCRSPSFLFNAPLVHGSTGKVIQGIVESARVTMLRNDEAFALLDTVVPPDHTDIETNDKLELKSSKDCTCAYMRGWLI